MLRSTVVAETFRPLVAATFDALDILEAIGVSGGLRIGRSLGSETGAGMDSEDDSMGKSPSVVSVPLSSCMKKSSPSD